LKRVRLQIMISALSDLPLLSFAAACRYSETELRRKFSAEWVNSRVGLPDIK
jgi:hypothetical protein